MTLNFISDYSNKFFSIEKTRDYVDDNSDPFFRLTGLDSALCCVFTPFGQVVLVDQFRPAQGVRTLEMPAGSINLYEKPVEAGEREFLEETGYKCELLALGNYNVMTNRTNIKEHVFFGLLGGKEARRAQEQGLSTVFLPREELVDHALLGAYRQIAGLGVITLANQKLGLDVLSAPMDQVIEAFRLKKEAS